jgi:selenocysteine lyase/cysteine desulfurase
VRDAAFAIDGVAAERVTARLMEGHRIFTVARIIKGEDGQAIDAVRVTPHLYTTTLELDLLVDAIRRMASA